MILNTYISSFKSLGNKGRAVDDAGHIDIQGICRTSTVSTLSLVSVQLFLVLVSEDELSVALSFFPSLSTISKVIPTYFRLFHYPDLAVSIQ